MTIKLLEPSASGVANGPLFVWFWNQHSAVTYLECVALIRVAESQFWLLESWYLSPVNTASTKHRLVGMTIAGVASPMRELADLILGIMPSVLRKLRGCEGEETFWF